MKSTILSSLLVMFLITVGCSQGTDLDTEEWTAKRRDELARCLTAEGWVMYGSITCSACRSQRKTFGDAFAAIVEIECNPHAPNTQVERCLPRKIHKTPTWILERDGAEIQRLEGYQLLENLAAASACE